MGTYLAPPSGRPSAGFHRWLKISGAVAALAIVLIILFRHAQITALYEMYWSQAKIEKLFYEDLGISQSWSAFIAVVGSFFYGLAWVPLSMWTYRVLVWRFNASQFSLAFLCWVFVYGHVPLLHALLGTDTCFNQRTGEPTKWYVQDTDGRLVLFDSPGFDSATGVTKQPVTTQICTAFANQKKNNRPRRITVDARQIEFFDAYTGRARVWYARSGNGPYELFDAYGYHPATSEPLHAVTKEVVSDIVRLLADEEAARIRAEEQRKAAEEEFRKRAEEERKAAEAEAQKRAEELRRQAEIEGQKRAEEQRQQEAAAAQKRAEEEKRQAAEARKRAEAERKQAEDDARKQAAFLRKQAEEWRKQAEADAQRRAEEQRIQAEAAERKRAEDKAILDSYVRTNTGALCRNAVRNGEARCECGSYMTLGPCY
jgi:DNA segregation ATPase FtsK/SpoIIIE-like protein